MNNKNISRQGGTLGFGCNDQSDDRVITNAVQEIYNTNIDFLGETRHHKENKCCFENGCEGNCGCSFTDKFGVQALVSDQEFDRKCKKIRKRECCVKKCGGHFEGDDMPAFPQSNGILGVNEQPVVQQRIATGCAASDQTANILMQLMRLYGKPKVTLYYKFDDQATGQLASLAPRPPYAGVVILKDCHNNVKYVVNLCEIVAIKLRCGNSFFDEGGDLKIRLLPSAQPQLTDCEKKSARAFSIFLASLVNTDTAVVVNVGGNELCGENVMKVARNVVFLDDDIVLFTDQIQSVKIKRELLQD